MNKFAIVLVITACFVSTLSAHKKKSDHKNSDINASPDVSVLAAGQRMVIKGSENGDITANETKLYVNDRKLKEKGKLHVELGEDGLYVNHKLVLKQNPEAPIITTNPNLRAKKVTSFEIQIDDQGQVTYVVKTSQ